MYRVKRDSAYVSIPAPPAGGTPGYFGPGDPGAGVQATIPGYEFFNNIQEEIIAPILAAGLTLDEDDRGQLLEAIRILSGRSALIVKTGPQVIPNNVGTAVSFGAVLYDEASLWSAGSPTRLTVPAGYTRARLSAGILFAHVEGGHRLFQITKNGMGYSGGVGFQLHPVLATEYDSISLSSGWVPVSGGDYFEAYFTQTKGSPLTIGATSLEQAGTWLFMEVKK